MAYKIGEINNYFLKLFPAKAACEWDKTGLLLGDPFASVDKIAIALDPTIDAVRQAKKIGANLLLTHHPAYVAPVEDFVASESVAIHNGSLVYEAATLGVALMNFHTALDVSMQGAALMPHLLNLIEGPVFVPTDNVPRAFSKIGFGRVCFVQPDSSLTESEYNDAVTSILQGQSITTIRLRELAQKAKKAFCMTPRVWGDFDKDLKVIATTSGSAKGKEFSDACIQAKIDCLVCGEIGYHDALALNDAGVCIIELGHDASELPYCNLFKRLLLEYGVSEKLVFIIDQTNNWKIV